VSKNGFHNGSQRSKCANCGRRFVGGERLNATTIWQEYTEGKQTYAQLASKYGCCIKTIQRKIGGIKPVGESSFSEFANVLMDTTYFGRNLGVMVFKNSLDGKILYKQYVKQETNALYLQGIKEISRRGIKIQAIICDGRKGLFELFGADIPVQMCNFHQVAIVRRYLTKKPKMQASKELWEQTLLLVHTDKESFVGGLVAWHTKWQVFLNERKKDEKGKKRYVHRRLRSAYNSLKNNLPWLFTWYDNIALKIPNTTNAIDGHFADLKNKLRNHNGLSVTRKKKFIDEFFKA
jgi:hypothetical protein